MLYHNFSPVVQLELSVELTVSTDSDRTVSRGTNIMTATINQANSSKVNADNPSSFEQNFMKYGTNYAKRYCMNETMVTSGYKRDAIVPTINLSSAELFYPASYNNVLGIEYRSIDRDILELDERLHRAFFLSELDFLLQSMETPYQYDKTQKAIYANHNAKLPFAFQSYDMHRSRYGSSMLYESVAPYGVTETDDKGLWLDYLGVNFVQQITPTRKALKGGVARFVIFTSTWRRFNYIAYAAGADGSYNQWDTYVSLFSNNEPVQWDFHFEPR